MKKFLPILFVTFYIYNPGFTQNPLVKQWDYRFGGYGDDKLIWFQQTSDGGFIFGGYSDSGIGADKTQANWGISPTTDYWIVKTDSLGNKQWDKDFGGTKYDWLLSLQQTTDGGYILGGTSWSDTTGNKTQPNRDTSGITPDYWIVKIDSLGNIQWDKVFGGTGYDYLSSVRQISDGGFILGGYSESGIGGDKTQPNWDTVGQPSQDYWIVKTDVFGNKLWDKDFGGTGSDQLFSIEQTTDGGYILGGFSNSSISGDKTQNTWGISDYWILKTDSLGNKQWDKNFGGTWAEELRSPVQQTADGGFMLGGTSESNSGGNKTQNLCYYPWRDYWIVKTDSLGNKQWDTDFGGTAAEISFGNIIQTIDKGYLMTGSSLSNISCDKTQNNLGQQQIWVIKSDSLGNTQWDKTFLTSGHDWYGVGSQTSDGCYVFANYSWGDSLGDKSQPAWVPGVFDYWIIKFCDTTLTTSSPTPALPGGEGVSIAPNPASDEITISCQQSINKIEIFNLLGKEVFHKQLSAFYFLLSTSSLPNGIYIIKAYTEKRILQQKLVINH